METRSIWPAQGLELRAKAGRPTIVGRFVYNALAVLADRGTVRKETIRPGAFAYDLADVASEISLLVGHDFGKPLASRQGGSLTLRDTDQALEFTAEIPAGAEKASHVADTLAMVEAGLVRGVSVGFRVPPRDVVPDAEELIPEPGNPSVKIRVLKALRLFEISLVTRAAYEESTAELRAMQTAHPVREQGVWLP